MNIHQRKSIYAIRVINECNVPLQSHWNDASGIKFSYPVFNELIT